MILYNDKKERICTLKDFKELCITSTLKTGDKEMSFQFRKESAFANQIKEEAYIRTKTDEFVIKQVDDGDGWNTCTAQLNVEELEGKQFPQGFTTTEQTVMSCITAAIEGTGWLVKLCEVTKKRTIKQESNCSAWDVIQSCITTYRCEIAFSALSKTISIYEKIGKDSGAYFIEKLNLKKLQIQSNSYDFCTRLIPVGKDGMMLNIGGRNYIENHQYSSKIKTKTWKDERYTVIDALIEDAEAKLEEVSKPYRSYTADVNDLAAAREEYKPFLTYRLGDTVELISKSKKIREKHRIVKMYEYPKNPERNKCELANTRLSFEELQKQEQEIQTAEISSIASETASQTVDDAVNNSSELKAMVAQIQATVESNVDDTMRQLYATKSEVAASQTYSEDYCDKVVTDELQSYPTTTQAIEIVESYIEKYDIELSSRFAGKKALSDVQKQAQEASEENRSAILWLIEKLDLMGEFETQFPNEAQMETKGTDGGETE